MLVRSALGMFCATALVTAAAAPAALASDRGNDRSQDNLRVTVCKQVHNRDGNGPDRHNRDRRFDFDARTDRDHQSFRLRDNQCERFHLRFNDNRFSLEENNTRGYNVRFRVRGDDRDTRSRDGRLWVRFDDRTFRPSLWIMVINTRDHHRGDGGGGGWNQN